MGKGLGDDDARWTWRKPHAALTRHQIKDLLRRCEGIRHLPYGAKAAAVAKVARDCRLSVQTVNRYRTDHAL